jgi:hypothetical protein
MGQMFSLFVASLAARHRRKLFSNFPLSSRNDRLSARFGLNLHFKICKMFHVLMSFMTLKSWFMTFHDILYWIRYLQTFATRLKFQTVWKFCLHVLTAACDKFRQFRYRNRSVSGNWLLVCTRSVARSTVW